MHRELAPSASLAQGLGCSNHSSGLRLRPQFHLYSVAEPGASARAGAVPLGGSSAPWFRGGVFCSCRGPRKTGTFGPPIVGFPRPRRPDVSRPFWCEASGTGWAGKFWLGASRLEATALHGPSGQHTAPDPLLREEWRSRYFFHCPGFQTSEATPMDPDSSIPKG